MALGLTLLGAAAGCRSMPGPPSLLDGGLVSSPPLPPEGEAAAMAHALFSIGIHHELADEYTEAYEAYRRAAEFDPDSEPLALRLASSLVLQRRTEEALRTVEAFIERRPASENALLWLATFYGTVGEQERVLDLYRRVTRQFPDQAMGWLQLAGALARSDRLDEAVDVLREGLTHVSPDTDLRQELVRLHLLQMRNAPDEARRAEQRRQAIEQLRRVAGDLPGDSDTLFALGDLLVEEEQLPDAIRVYEQIDRLHPADAQVKQRLARTFLAMDDPDKAAAILEELAREQPGPVNTAYYLGEIYLQAGDTANALRFFRTAAENAVDDPSAWLRLAALQSETSDEVAVATLREALDAMPGNAKLLEVLALVRLNQRRYSLAADLFAQAWKSLTAEGSEAVPSNLFFYHYATTCTHLRRTQEAAEWLQRAVELDPEMLDLYMQRSLTATSRFRQTAARVLRALAKRVSSPMAAIHVHLGTLLLAEEHTSRAIREFDRAVTIVRRDPLQSATLTPRFFFWYGVALDQDGQTDRAVEMFESCIRLDPDYADALNYLAYLWAVRAIRLDEALRHIQTALSLDPGNAAYIDTLGWIYHQMGRYEEALDVLERADQLLPDDPEILDHLEKTREKLGR